MDASGEVLAWHLAAGWNRVRVVNDPATGDTRFVTNGHARIAWVLAHQWRTGLPVGYS